MTSRDYIADARRDTALANETSAEQDVVHRATQARLADERAKQLSDLCEKYGLPPGASASEITQAMHARKALVKDYLHQRGGRSGVAEMRKLAGELGIDPHPGGDGADWDRVWDALVAADHRYLRITRNADNTGYIVPPEVTA